jgi:transcriptional regulator with XRE-family HTH domain
MIPPMRLARPLIVQFGERLYAMRKRAGVSQAYLATRSRVGQRHVRKLERGTSNPTLATLILLADALGCELADFFPRARD